MSFNPTSKKYGYKFLIKQSEIFYKIHTLLIQNIELLISSSKIFDYTIDIYEFLLGKIYGIELKKIYSLVKNIIAEYLNLEIPLNAIKKENIDINSLFFIKKNDILIFKNKETETLILAYFYFENEDLQLSDDLKENELFQLFLRDLLFRKYTSFPQVFRLVAEK